jgi:hypothetical protein
VSALVHVLRDAARIKSVEVFSEPRWCFICRKRVHFSMSITEPPPMSYYGPTATVSCPRGHVDGDCFPGTYREWGEV